MVIKSVQQVVRERMSECVDIAVEQYIESIRPIYGVNRSGGPEHIGTCVMVEIDGNCILVTAAHVIDENKYTNLYVGVGQSLKLLEGDFYCTAIPETGRDDDHFDFAWLTLAADQLEKFEGANFVPLSDISDDDSNYQGVQYLVLGYPNSKNKKTVNVSRAVKPKYIKYSSTAKHIKELCAKLNIPDDTHIFLDYNEKHSKDDEGNMVNSYSPRGVSGGALINLGRQSNPYAYLPSSTCVGKLSGLLIEFHKEFNALVAIKFVIIICEIRKTLGSA